MLQLETGHGAREAIPAQAHLGSTRKTLPAPFAVRRLGWCGLHLEPEYLAQRIIDTVERLRGSHHLVERISPFAEIYVVEVRFDATRDASESVELCKTLLKQNLS